MSFALSLWIFYFIFNYDFLFVLFGSFLTGFFSFLPDLDIKIIKKLEKLNKNSFYLFYLLIWPIKHFFRHRGITHSIWIPIILFYFAEFHFMNFVIIFVFRFLYLSLILHILEDMFTVSGVDLFFPLNFRVRFFKFSTNSDLHFLFFIFVSFLLIVAFFIVFRII